MGDLFCVTGHTLDVDKVKLPPIRVERVERRNWLFVKSTKPKPEKNIHSRSVEDDKTPVICCRFDNLVLDPSDDGGEVFLDLLHGLGQVDHEVDVHGVFPPLGDELDPVFDRRP